ncbi:hypothetical protein ACT0K6_000160 [Enterococcus faecalis]|uniref:hypothetical protein n=1 Tax=Enterococcus faecalis TaxID=1351 RepID=UPI000CF15488|nr:hypothetical protein [Enterococcus faecalis]MBO6372958.1 hypothetical protein [Enterococcus faecalis]MDN3096596.1 hypothetical protein [Enterococcus faecalis]PQD11474.1 hypothetical protein CUM65_04030 [Enterococcus faecalis]PQG37168.1 hypothetical protein CUS34_10795 [Enterococcus faecalis]RXV23845.1 hypothetical protein CYQ36_02035 [Enterococcus faecalis]
MGLIVQHDEIISVLKQLDIYNEDELIIYATLKTSQPLYMRVNELDLRNYIVEGAWLAISKNDVKILAVNQLGKLQEEVTVISKKDLASLSIKKNLFLYTITMKDLEGNSVSFKVSSRVVGNRNHHLDFIKLVKHLGKAN